MRIEFLKVDINSRYREAYDNWHDVLSTDPDANSPWYRLLKTHLNFQGLKSLRILEIGCGRGDFSCWLARELGDRAEIWGADFSVTAIQKARSFADSQRLQVRWLVMDIQNIAAHTENFDIVLCCETLEHVPHPARALAELSRVLKPGGRLFLTTPNYLGLMGLYRIYLRLAGRRYTEAGQPINNFTLLPRTIAWVRTAGLKVDGVDAIGHYLPWPGKPPVEMSFFNDPRWLMRWTGLHSLVIAHKLIS